MNNMRDIINVVTSVKEESDIDEGKSSSDSYYRELDARELAKADGKDWKSMKYGEKEEYRTKVKAQSESQVNEDSIDDDKWDQLNNMFMSVDALKQEVEELAKMDTQEGASGTGDLHDQITTMYNLLDKFDDVIDRSTNIVPVGANRYES